VDIDSLRRKIDEIDGQILRLINERLEIAQSIGRAKGESGTDYYAPKRERDVYERVLAANPGPLKPEGARAIFREIMSATLALEKPIHVAYWGPEGTFTHQAAIEKFGASSGYLPVPSIADVFAEVQKGRADYGVVPIENSTEGIVNHTLDMFVDSDLKICSEISIEIHHCLLGRGEMSDVRRVYSGPQPFAQCRNWLDGNLPHVEQVEVSTTSRAAQVAAAEEKAAAIAGSLAADIYDLDVLAERIEDSQTNVTRFLVIGHNWAEPSDRDKTSIMFSIKDRVGALYQMLVPFKAHDINLTRIESRPSKRKAWDYFFFVDLSGHCEDSRVRLALSELEEQCLFLKVLGSYPVSEGSPDS